MGVWLWANQIWPRQTARLKQYCKTEAAMWKLCWFHTTQVDIGGSVSNLHYYWHYYRTKIIGQSTSKYYYSILQIGLFIRFPPHLQKLAWKKKAWDPRILRGWKILSLLQHTPSLLQVLKWQDCFYSTNCESYIVSLPLPSWIFVSLNKLFLQEDYMSISELLLLQSIRWRRLCFFCCYTQIVDQPTEHCIVM